MPVIILYNTPYFFRTMCVFVNNTCLFIKHMLYLFCSSKKDTLESLPLGAPKVYSGFYAYLSGKRTGHNRMQMFYSLESCRQKAEALIFMLAGCFYAAGKYANKYK